MSYDDKAGAMANPATGEATSSRIGSTEGRLPGHPDAPQRNLSTASYEQLLPFLLPFRKLTDQLTVAHLGSGQGEWFEYLHKIGFRLAGFDLDDARLLSATSLGLPKSPLDVPAFLRSCEESSFDLVSAFHWVDGLDLSLLGELFAELPRILKPGGLLILVTRDPERALLGFQHPGAEGYGDHLPHPDNQTKSVVGPRFQHRLIIEGPLIFNGAQSVRDQQVPTAWTGIGRDYAAIAQKAVGPELSDFLAEIFDLASWQGHALRILHESKAVCVYQNEWLERRAEDLQECLIRMELIAAERQNQRELAEARARELGAQAEIALGRANRAEAEVAAERRRVEELATRIGRQEGEIESFQHRLSLAEEQSRMLEAHAADVAAERDALRRSWSWRLMRPLRWLGAGAQRLHVVAIAAWRTLGLLLRRLLEAPLLSSMGWVLRRPGLAARLGAWLRRFPRVHQPLVRIAQRAGLLPTAMPRQALWSAADAVDTPPGGAGAAEWHPTSDACYLEFREGQPGAIETAVLAQRCRAERDGLRDDL